MKKLVFLLLTVLYLTGCQQRSAAPDATQQSTPAIREENQTAPTTDEWQVERYATGLSVPWSLVFTDEKRMLVTERAGTIRAVINGEVSAPLIQIENVRSNAEEGLMGMVLDPDYQTNGYVYVCYAQRGGAEYEDVVARLIDLGDEIVFDRLLLNAIPAARFHAGCQLEVSPDNKLFVTTGDATDAKIAQDLDSLGGKILRMNLDGTIPSDNPFPRSYVYSYGHRNPQGLDWHPETLELYATEHGPSGFDGPPGGDEVNLIKPGANYGWPTVSHEESQEGLEDPLLVFTPAEAPGSGHFYAGEVLPAFTNTFLFGALRGEGIGVLEFGIENPEQVLSYKKLDLNYGRIRPITTGPDGYIYFATSNTDGRGEPADFDDSIYRIVPER